MGDGRVSAVKALATFNAKNAVDNSQALMTNLRIATSLVMRDTRRNKRYEPTLWTV